MIKTDNLNIIFSKKSIAKNTIYNLLGYGIPLIFALVLIPLLINRLGTERFGILSLAWIIIGYFSFFDFGIGKGLTKIIAEKISLNQNDEISTIFWTSLISMFCVSLLFGLALSFFVPNLIVIFNISPEMQQETLGIFFILFISIPIVSTTAGLRGVLEAHQKFFTINFIRVFLGMSTFFGPFVVLVIKNSLFWVIIFLILIRIILWFLYLFQCFKVNTYIKKNIVFDLSSIKPVLKFSFWITIANVVGPIILYSDRFLIAALISAEAVTYYATPYEIITKILLISGALTGVLFPIFSASFFNNRDISKKILLKGIKYIFLIVYPMILIIITFSFEVMKIWLGGKFAGNSYIVLQFLAIGIFMNSLSSIPNNFFQGIGKPKIPTIINSMELPFYIIIMWFSINKWGINGAAFAYMLLATIDATIMYLVLNKLFNIRFESRIYLFVFFLTLALLIFPFFFSNIFLKVVFLVFSLLFFLMITWKYFLSSEEKLFIFSKVRSI